MANMTTRPIANATQRAAATTYLWGHTSSGPATDLRVAMSDMVFKDGSGNVAIPAGNLSVGQPTVEAAISAKTNSNTTSSIATRSVTGDVGTAALSINKFDNNSTTSQVLVQFTINNGGAGSGRILANGAGQATFGSFSDERLKKNIKNLEGQLDKILSLRPVEFEYRKSIGGGLQLGFIAQEIGQVFPDVVNEDSSGFKVVAGFGRTEAILIAAIQELAERNASLEARLSALESPSA